MVADTPFAAWSPTVPVRHPDTGEVLVFGFSLETALAEEPGASRLLTESERRTASTMVRERDRTAYKAVRVAMKALLSSVSGLPLSRITFLNGANGKPFFSVLADTTNIRFNLSHSGAFAILAVSSKREIGVDIERIRPVREIQDTVRYSFSPEETRQLKKLHGGELQDSFYAVWVRKEAVIKMAGLSVGRDMDLFTVPTTTRQITCRVELPLEHGEPTETYTVVDIPCSGPYRAALCADQRPARVTTTHLHKSRMRDLVRGALDRERTEQR